MFEQIIAFFTAIMTFFMNLFGIMPGTVKQFKNVSYGSASIQVMDVYYPNSADKITEPIGAVIMIHGGAWTSRSKDDYSSVAKDIANKGYITANINYRMFGDGATAFDMMDDIDAAIAKLKEKTEADGIAIKSIATYGDSAGGHLSLMYSYTHLNGTANAAPIPIAFCVGRVAPANFDDFIDTFNPDYIYELVSNLTGESIKNAADYQSKRAIVEAVSPYFLASADVPPTIIAYGAVDNIVPIANGHGMKQKLTDLNVTFDYFEFPNSGHLLNDKKDKSVSNEFTAKLLEYAELYF